jgi:hypothetical protein
MTLWPKTGPTVNQAQPTMHVCRNNLLVPPCSWTMGLAGNRTMARDDPAETLDMAWRDRFRLEQRTVLDDSPSLGIP